jgi:hypothetical protein
MLNFLSFTSQPAAILVFRLLGISLLIVGLITAAYNVTLGGITPTIWILLGISSFLGAICNTFFAIRNHLEQKDQG